MSDSAIPWTAVCQALLSMGFTRHSWESVANSFSRGSSQLRGQTHISGIMGSYSLQGTPRDIFPTRVNAEAESVLVVLIWLQDTPQPQTSRNFRKTRFIAHKSYRVKSIPEPHNKVRDTKEGETEYGPEVLLLLGSRVRFPGFHSFSLYWWI